MKKQVLILLIVLVSYETHSQFSIAAFDMQYDRFNKIIIKNNSLHFEKVHEDESVIKNIISETLTCTNDTCEIKQNFKIGKNNFSYVVKKDTNSDLLNTKVYDSYFIVNNVLLRDSTLNNIGQTINEISVAHIDSSLFIILSAYFYNSCCGNSAENYFLFTIDSDRISHNFFKQYSDTKYFLCNLNNDSFIDLLKFEDFDSLRPSNEIDNYERIHLYSMHVDNQFYELSDNENRPYFILIENYPDSDRCKVIDYNWLYKIE